MSHLHSTHALESDHELHSSFVKSMNECSFLSNNNLIKWDVVTSICNYLIVNNKEDAVITINYISNTTCYMM